MTNDLEAHAQKLRDVGYLLMDTTEVMPDGVRKSNLVDHAMAILRHSYASRGRPSGQHVCHAMVGGIGGGHGMTTQLAFAISDILDASKDEDTSRKLRQLIHSLMLA